MVHWMGGRTWDLYLSARHIIGSGLLVVKEIWGRQLTTRGVKLGSQKVVILAAQNEPKLGVPSVVYLHAGLEIGSSIPYAIYWESN